jgi:UDP-N-acetylglucosamine 4-epimerase
MSQYEEQSRKLRAAPKSWLITGAAGFIGSNLLERLLKLDQRVVGLDNFSTGHRHNLDEVECAVSAKQWSNFAFFEGDIRHADTCRVVCRDADYVLHQAALGSVPGSIADPFGAHDHNVTGFVNMLVAARDAKVQRFVYASSCAVYGDLPEFPKREETPGNILSPYAATKMVNELYAEAFARCYNLGCVGLRYFNVFGPRQDPNGPYAAVIPKWTDAMIGNEAISIHGDGETSRDFCYVANVVQANLLAALTEHAGQLDRVYNVAVGKRTTLNQLFAMLRHRLLPECPHLAHYEPVYGAFRAGDVRHSQADIGKAEADLGFEPTHRTEEGLREALNWYLANRIRQEIQEPVPA